MGPFTMDYTGLKSPLHNDIPLAQLTDFSTPDKALGIYLLISTAVKTG
jgi:hypothetical protein